MKCGDRVLEYMRERGERRMRELEHARREHKDRNKWRLFCRGHPLTGRHLRDRQAAVSISPTQISDVHSMA